MATTAITRWTNALSTGSWDSDGNWSAGKPDATYGGWFDGNVQDDVTTGLDQSAVDTPFIHRGESYNGNIGTTGSPLIISTDLLWLEGPGFMNFRNGNGNTDQVVIDAFNMGNAALLDGDIRRLWVLKGEASIPGGSANTANLLAHVGSRGGIEDAKLTVGPTSGLGPIVQRAGLIEYNDTVSALPQLQLSGGHFIYDAEGSSITETYQHGGRLTGKGLVALGGYYLLGGTGDFSVDGFGKIIQSLFRMPGTKLLENNNMDIVQDNSPIPIN